MKYWISKQGYIVGNRNDKDMFVMCPYSAREDYEPSCGDWCPLFESFVGMKNLKVNGQFGVAESSLCVNLHCGGGTRTIQIDRDEREVQNADEAVDILNKATARMAEQEAQKTEEGMIARMKSAVSNIICQSFNFGNVESKMKDEELNKRANEGVDEIVKAIKGV